MVSLPINPSKFTEKLTLIWRDAKFPYTPIASEETQESKPQSEERRKGRNSFFQFILILEALHLVLMLSGYALVMLVRYELSVTDANGLDAYFDLANYNTVKNFHGDAELMNRSAISDAFFERIQRTDGIVAVDTEWALNHNYAPSISHPEDPSRSIYQIDMFHSIHCVYRIRNLLTSSLSLEEWPRNDEHTLHCLDYVREQLMCNSDLTLEATENLVLFKINKGHLCRNSDAIMEWALAHHWDGHRQYLKDTIGFE